MPFYYYKYNCQELKAGNIYLYQVGYEIFNELGYFEE